MKSEDILAMRGGHKVIADTTAYGATDYRFYGFIPTTDAAITTLKMGSEDLSASVAGNTYYAGIYYGLPGRVNNGQGSEITLASGSVVLVLALDSPTHY